jgi:uroporphyrin-III C-methyltransferase / precorrin-2 dehydrogenase / sirohydrochlorin ferrochelatase
MKMQSQELLRNKARRIDALEVLPVFLKLDGKRAIVVGSSNGALWKAELLLQAGAHVTLVCQEVPAQFFDLMSGECTGRIDFLAMDWQSVSFDGAALLIGDIEEGDAEEFYVKSRKAGAIVNIIDKPDYCDIQFGAIVNRSPVVIGISTGGAAPVLAQLVRSVIETSLPERLQALAKKAKLLRGKVNARLVTAERRRSYWSAFFERLNGGVAKRRSGPYHIKSGDVQSLTVRDLAALRNADHLYLCQGASEEIAKLARREAQRHMVKDAETNVAMLANGVILTV